MGSEQEPREEQRKARESKTKKILIIGAIVVVVLIAAASEGMHLTSQPSFCGTCHEISPQVASWRTGPHNNVPCLRCHANPGTVGYVSRKLAGLGEVYLQVTGQIPAKIEARFNIQTCIVCHTGQISAYPNAKNITLTSGSLAPSANHTEILAENISCLQCHSDVGHGKSGQ